LYSHSVGFYELIKEVTKTISHGKEAIRTNIWRVFSVLLQYACKPEQQFILANIESEYEQKIVLLKDEIA